MDALGKFEGTQQGTVAHEVTPRATLTPLNFPRTSITRYMHAKHEPILELFILFLINENFVVRNIPSERNKIISLHFMSRSRLHFFFFHR